MTNPLTITTWTRAGLAGWCVTGAGRCNGAVMGQHAAHEALVAALRACLTNDPRPEAIWAPLELVDALDALRSTGMADGWLAGRLAELDLAGVAVSWGEVPGDDDRAAAHQQAAEAALALAAGNARPVLDAKLRWSDDRRPPALARIIADELGRDLIADALGVPRGTVHGWMRRGIALAYVPRLAEMTGLPAELIRQS